MKIFDAFPSKYLKAADLQGRNIEAIMQHVMLEEIKDPKDPEDAKVLPVLYFQGVPKGMVLNKTNAKVIAAGYGQETEAWRDMPIMLFSAMVDAWGETVDAIRVRLPAAREGVLSIDRPRDDDSPLGKPIFPDAAARKQAAMTTLPKKDARDIYTKMRAEVDASVSPDDLNEWIEASSPRIKLLPPEWQEILRMRMSEKMLDLQQQAKPGHDQDGIVWEADGERPLTDEEKVEAFRQSLQRANAAMDERIAQGHLKIPAKNDGMDIPAAFDRRTKREPALKDRLLADILALATVRDCLAWGLTMDHLATGLPKAEREEISEALIERQTALLNHHERPAAHQHRLFPIDGGARA
jgi:hypothetical protein